MAPEQWVWRGERDKKNRPVDQHGRVLKQLKGLDEYLKRQREEKEGKENQQHEKKKKARTAGVAENQDEAALRTAANAQPLDPRIDNESMNDNRTKPTPNSNSDPTTQMPQNGVGRSPGRMSSRRDTAALPKKHSVVSGAMSVVNNMLKLNYIPFNAPAMMGGLGPRGIAMAKEQKKIQQRKIPSNSRKKSATQPQCASSITPPAPATETHSDTTSATSSLRCISNPVQPVDDDSSTHHDSSTHPIRRYLQQTSVKNFLAKKETDTSYNEVKVNQGNRNEVPIGKPSGVKTDPFIADKQANDLLLKFPFSGKYCAVERAAEGLEGIQDSPSFKVCLYNQRALNNPVTIYVKDYHRLEPGVYLNDTVIDFWFNW